MKLIVASGGVRFILNIFMVNSIYFHFSSVNDSILSDHLSTPMMTRDEDYFDERSPIWRVLWETFFKYLKYGRNTKISFNGAHLPFRAKSLKIDGRWKYFRELVYKYYLGKTQISWHSKQWYLAWSTIFCLPAGSSQSQPFYYHRHTNFGGASQ